VKAWEERCPWEMKTNSSLSHQKEELSRGQFVEKAE
jgi:hypothetical protein